jgi:hypothetical protein
MINHHAVFLVNTPFFDCEVLHVAKFSPTTKSESNPPPANIALQHKISKFMIFIGFIAA